MPESKTKKYSVLASVPTVMRYLGLFGALIGVGAIIAGFYFAGSSETFRSGDFPAKLSKNVVGVVEGYERKTSVAGVPKYLVIAAKATTFDDNHQEFDDVLLRLFKDGDESRFDRIKSDRAIFIPDPDDADNYRVFFAGSVEVESETRLKVETEQLQFRSREELAIAEEKVNFSRDNLSGVAGSARVDIKNETLELKTDVKIVSSGKSEFESESFDVKRADLHAGYAFVKKSNESILLRDGVDISVLPADQSELENPTNVKTEKAEVFFREQEIERFVLTNAVRITQLGEDNKPINVVTGNRATGIVDGGLKTFDLDGNVVIISNRAGGPPIKISGDSATYKADNEIFEIVNDVRIVSEREGKDIDAGASKVVYQQARGLLDMFGAVEIKQGTDRVRGEHIEARLDESNQIKFAKAEDGADLYQENENGRTTVKGSSIEALFADGGKITSAKVNGKTDLKSIPKETKDYSSFALMATKGLNLGFQANGDVKSAVTEGRTTIILGAGTSDKTSSKMKLTADKVKTVFRASGNELLRAHAIGDAVLEDNPKSPTDKDFNSEVRSPRFDCEFFEKNRVRECVSKRRSFLKRTPVSRNGEVQKLETNQMTARFNATGGDIAEFIADGRSRFTQGNRKGNAERIVYVERTGLVTLAGGQPTVWDTSARAKASKIVWDTKNDASTLSGGVSTTYFNPGSAGGSTPFSDNKSPVFLTASSARFEHKKRNAFYEGNARAWQDKNYISADKLYLEELNGRMFAQGKVKSGLYNASKTVGGRETKAPVFVTAGEMLFVRKQNILTYSKAVDIRQGTDRIRADKAEVFLKTDNSLARTVAKGNVIITQPKRKATGSYASYDADSEIVKLLGNPATFSDAESGSSTGRELTVNLKNNTAENKAGTTKNSRGRIRSVYKVKGGRLN